MIVEEDRRLEQQVCAAVQQRLQHGAHARLAREISWHFQGGRLTLRGRVPNFHAKQVLQESVKNIAQVRQIRNEVEVASWAALDGAPQRQNNS
jgi:osmotically-inducible protein OsmY